MKKSLLAIGLSLTMVLAMATPAFAVNANGDGGTVDKPGHPVYDGVNLQVVGESFNAATATSADGTTWQVANDDDTDKTAVDKTADINVWAKVVDSGSKVYKVDLAWGAMKFEYTNTAGKWNTETHAYDKTGTGTAAWTVTDYLEGVNNKVTVTNHSNNGINAAFAYAMDGTNKFNDAAGKDNVVGNFFDTVDKAKTAATKLVDTYDAAGTTATDVPTKLAGPIALATADAYNNGTADQLKGAREGMVYFAFSGTPDTGKGKTLDTFKKVGVITVTVTPNNDVNLNKPVATP